MTKLQFHPSKVLKLTNVLEYTILMDDEKFDLNTAIKQMQSYIKTKGALQIGPLIQYTQTTVNEQQELTVKIIMMLQCNHYIHNTEYPYCMEAVIRIPDALYCRYIGSENKIKFAYDKINLYAFENDIPLKGDSYTIFVGRDEDNDTITADVFMERTD